MWKTILINIILSITIILVAHHIWDHLKSNYSTQKTKNLAEIHAAKYKTILNDLERQMQKPSDSLLCIGDAYLEPTPPKYITVEEQEWMKQELDSFIQSL